MSASDVVSGTRASAVDVPDRPGDDRARRRSGRARRRLGQVLLATLLSLFGLLMLMPVVWVVIESFELPGDQFRTPPVWIPHSLTLSSYRTLFAAAPFVENLLNSVFITLAVVLGSALVSVLAAYAFARLEFPGRELLFLIFLSALTIPTQVSAVPEFVVVRYLHLLNSRLAIVVPALIQVVGIFLLRQHFRTIPRELDDAAVVDGAGHLGVLRHVIVPMSWPAISAIMVITGQYIWNDFFWPLLFITSRDKMPAPLALYNLQSTQGGGPIGAVFAGLSVLSVPVVIAFIFLQRRLMEGIGYAGISR